MNKLNTNTKKGFTLLELLIVIAIIAVLSVLLIIVLDPSETLKRARDSQRVNDLATLKTALGIYLTNTSSPLLDGGTNICLGESGPKIAYSYPYQTSAPTCTMSPKLVMGTDAVTTTIASAAACYMAASSTYTEANGSGWIPVNFVGLTGGSPISNLPIDPVNTIASTTAPQDTDYTYRYVCQQQTTNSSLPAHAYQMAAVLESSLYGPSNPSGLDSKDGGANSNYYEVGSDNNLLPATDTDW